MEKTDLITCIANKTGLSRRQASMAVNSVIETIQESLLRGEPVRISGLGAFELKPYAERIGRDLSSNTPVVIPARCLPFCRFSDTFKRHFK